MFSATVEAGLPETCVQRVVAQMAGEIEAIKGVVQQINSPPAYSSETLVGVPRGGGLYDVTVPPHEAAVTSYFYTALGDGNASASSVLSAGRRMTFLVQSDSANARTITFTTHFRPNGTLTSPATASKYVTASFESDGTDWIETGRQTAGV